MALRVSAYISTDGNAKEAIAFYEKALEAKVVKIVTFDEIPEDPDFKMPADAKDRVAHAGIKIGESEVMISDTLPGEPPVTGCQVSVCILTSDEAKSKQYFDALAEEGKVLMSLQKTFWSPAYGLVIDKFGVMFHINMQPKESCA